MLHTYIHTDRHTDIQTEPLTKRVLEEHSLLKTVVLSTPLIETQQKI